MSDRHIIISLGLLFITCGMHAQQASSYRIREYSTENGLPSNGIKGMQWDAKNRFLWMATEAGITRFNGMEFKTFSRNNTPGIHSDRTLFIIRDQHSNILTADLEGSIFRIDRNKIVFKESGFYKNGPGPGRNNFFLLPVSELFFRKKLLPDSLPALALNVNKVLPLSDTSCYVINNSRLMYYSISMDYPSYRETTVTRLKTGFVAGGQQFVADKNNTLYRITPEGGLEKTALLQENGQPFKLSSGAVLYVWENGMEGPILFNNNNAWLLHFNGSAAVATLICDIVPLNSYVRCAQYDKEDGILFIGTESKGIIMISRDRVTSVHNERSGINERNAYYAQLELPNGNILTNEGHILGNARTPNGTLPIKGKFNFSVNRMDDSLLWYNQVDQTIGYNCLHCYHYKTGKTTIYPKIPVRELSIITRSGGKLFLGTDRGVGILEGDSMRLLMNAVQGSYLSIAYDLKEVRPGVLAFASCNGLILYHVDSGKKDTLFHESNYCVRTIRIINGYMFFGTYGRGFFIYKDGKLRHMPADKNKYLLYAHCFMPDKNGFVWISTNHGLFKASINDLINAFEKDLSVVYYHYFGRDDGMDMTELNGGCTPCALEMSNQQFSFPTMDGLLWVDPLHVSEILPTGEIYIDEISVNGVSTDAAVFEKIPLAASTGEIDIYTGFSAFCNKENIYLEYKLNDDPEWKSVNTNGDAVIRFTNLPQGSYRLQIRKINGFGPGNYVYHELHFSIAVPWYKTWWFALLILLSIMAGLLLFYRIRTRQLIANQKRLESIVAQKTKELQEKNEVLEKNDSIKTRLISIISHDIVTPLKFLHVAGRNLLQNRKMIPDNLQEETISEMAQTSQDLQLLSTNILNWIKYQNENRRLVKDNFNITDLVKQVTGILSAIAKQKNIQLYTEIDPQLSIYQYYDPLKIVIYNLLSNAINFSEHGRITITAGPLSNGLFTLNVTDQGTGMTPEQIQQILKGDYIVSSANMDNKKGNGLGYLIIKDLLKMLGGTLAIRSEKGSGSTITISMPATAGK